MTRTLYRCLLQLHPPGFRRQFAREMQWIFEEAAASEGAMALLLDLLVSLLRQWLLRSGSWKVAAGAIGGLLEILVCITVMAPSHKTATTRPSPPHRSAAIAARFNGHWEGNFQWPGPFGKLSLTLSKLDETPSAEIQVRLENGELRTGLVGSIQVDSDSLSFPVRIGDSNLTFRGRLLDGKPGPRLTGVLQPTSNGT